jgi:pilus assembly protein Flp/PilA
MDQGAAVLARATFLKRKGAFPALAGTNRGKEKNMSNFIKMIKDESGASAAEYALILAIVGTGIAIAALILGGAIGNSMNSAANCINNPTNTTC